MEASAKAEERGLLERGPELEAAERAMRRACEGSGSGLLLEGPAGIGKSGLVEAFVEGASEQGIGVLTARAAHLERGFSFGVVLQLLADRVYDRLTADAVSPSADPLRGAAAKARPLFEDHDSAGTRLSGDSAFSLLHGLYWLVANLAESSPLLICVDDVHWADRSSLAFLNFLAQRIEHLPVLVVLARRVGEPSEDDALLVELGESGSIAPVHPAPLSQRATVTLVQRLLPGAEDELCRACWRMTRGNPLYLRELIAAIRNDGLRPDAASEDAVVALNPESISRTIRARPARLPPSARALADAVAVLGDDASLQLAAHLAEIDHSDAVGAADILAAAEILAPEEPLSFCHPIVAGAVYAGVPGARRAEAHLSAGRLLDRAGAAPETVASHLLAAERGADGWVRRSLRRAAERARARGAQDAALRYLRRALEEQPPAEARGELLALCGLAEAEAGETQGSETLGEAVDVISDPQSRARALFDLAMILTHGGRYPHAAAAAERGLEELGDAGTRLARELRALYDMSVTWVDLTDARATRARLARATAEPTLEETSSGRGVLANAAVGFAFAGGDASTMRELARRALSVPEPGDDSFDRVVFPVAGFALALAGDLQAAERAASTAVESSLRHGSILDHGAATQVRAVSRLQAGRAAEALSDAESAVAAGRWGWGATLPMAHAQAVFGSIERADLEAAEAALELPGGEERWSVNVSYGTYLVARAELLRETGRGDEALEQLLLAGRLADLVNAVTPVVCPWRPSAAGILVERGERDRAEELAAEELEVARRFGAPGPIGVGLRALGLAAPGDRGLDLLGESVEVLRGSEARLQLARSIVAHGAALRRAGQPRQARETLREGLDLAHRCGAVALADTAAEELRVAGGRPRRRALRGVESLTPSELRTARMAAEGLSNREIAERLFVTRRTVEMHLSSAYGKLEIPSREGLAAALGGDAVAG